jgi:hypothetical protein
MVGGAAMTMDYKPDMREKLRWILFDSKTTDERIDQILALPEIKDGLTLRTLYRDWNTTGRTYDKR